MNTYGTSTPTGTITMPTLTVGAPMYNYGTYKTVTRAKCPVCDGTGDLRRHGFKEERCNSCGASGLISLDDVDQPAKLPAGTQISVTTTSTVPMGSWLDLSTGTSGTTMRITYNGDGKWTTQP